MSDMSQSNARAERPARVNLLWIALPLAVLGLAIAWLLSSDPLSGFRNGAPPVENLTFERTILGLSLIHI